MATTTSASPTTPTAPTARRNLQDWLGEYAESHQNSFNKKIHHVAVPVIMMAVLGLLVSIPAPFFVGFWAVLFVLGTGAFYWRLSPRMAIGMGVLSLVIFGALGLLALLPIPLWATCTTLFVVAWICQFIGHHAEGKKPSFFKDLQFLLIGPLWVMDPIFRGLGISEAPATKRAPHRVSNPAPSVR